MPVLKGGFGRGVQQAKTTRARAQTSVASSMAAQIEQARSRRTDNGGEPSLPPLSVQLPPDVLIEWTVYERANARAAKQYRQSQEALAAAEERSRSLP